MGSVCVRTELFAERYAEVFISALASARPPLLSLSTNRPSSLSSIKPTIITMAPSQLSTGPPPTAKSTAQKPTTDSNDGLRDLRGSTLTSNTDANLQKAIVDALTAKITPYRGSLIRSLPTMILYSARGLEIYDKITYLQEYYLFESEVQILARHAGECVAKTVRSGSVLVELGCGAMRKTKHILDSIVEQRLTGVTYYAVDLSEESLRESLAPLREAFPSITFVGLLGTYEDSVDYVAKTVPATTPKTYLWLGSSIGNLDRPAAAAFLRDICAKGMNPGDTFLCGIDRRNASKDIALAYDDPSGVTRDFILEGLDNVNTIFGTTVFDRAGFAYVSEYQEEEGRHAAYYRSLKKQTLRFREGAVVELDDGEMINVEYSYKWSSEEVNVFFVLRVSSLCEGDCSDTCCVLHLQVNELVETAGFYNVGKWSDPKDMYDLHLFQKPPFFFPKHAATTPVPTLAEWEELWKAWDFITSTMIPVSTHLTRPIALRHPYIFYLGHIPAFLDIQLSRATESPLTEPRRYAEIFERGIDPCMDTGITNPHSTVPDAWPVASDIAAYKLAVRDRVRGVLAKPMSKRVRRVVWMCWEHEAMHIETLLYMLVQGDATTSPLGVLEPIARVAATTSGLHMRRFAKEGALSVGMNDPEPADGDSATPAPTVYGWDVEKPLRTAAPPPPFEAAERMVTVAEYAAFLARAEHDPALIPASWAPLDNSHGVKTVFGLRSIAACGDMPVAVSYTQASAYAAFAGARVATQNEVRVARAALKKGDLPRCYGFASWIPRGGDGGDEGLWEWTSSVFERGEDYVPSEVYPGYSSDFL